MAMESQRIRTLKLARDELIFERLRRIAIILLIIDVVFLNLDIFSTYIGVIKLQGVELNQKITKYWDNCGFWKGSYLASIPMVLSLLIALISLLFVNSKDKFLRAYIIFALFIAVYCTLTYLAVLGNNIAQIVYVLVRKF